MQEKQRIVIAGGDLRQIYAAAALKALGHHVTMVGFSKEQLPEQAAQAAEQLTLLPPEESVPQSFADVLVLPVRFSAAADEVPAPYGAQAALSLSKLLLSVKPDGIVCGGQAAVGNDLYLYINYMACEMLAQANAVLTAEGAMSLAMQNTGQSCWRRQVLIIGGGRIAAVLAHHLRALGAAVTAAARSAVQRTKLSVYGVETIPLPLKPQCMGQYDWIFNTVPAPVFQRTHLEQVSQTGIVLDLASAPYGLADLSGSTLPSRYVCAAGIPPSAAC